MRKILRLITWLVLVIAIISLAGCAIVSKDIISETGTVRFIELEGEFYGIVSDDGQHYDPINLNQEFREDGLRISFQLKIRNDVANTRMWGTPVEIINIMLCKT